MKNLLFIIVIILVTACNSTNPSLENQKLIEDELNTYFDEILSDFNVNKKINDPHNDSLLTAKGFKSLNGDLFDKEIKGHTVRIYSDFNKDESWVAISFYDDIITHYEEEYLSDDSQTSSNTLVSIMNDFLTKKGYASDENLTRLTTKSKRQCFAEPRLFYTKDGSQDEAFMISRGSFMTMKGNEVVLTLKIPKK